MRLDGTRLRRTRLIQKGRYVVAVDVELVVPPEDPSEACYESETIEFLRQVERRAARGDLAWLRKVGKVFQLVGS
ncbi:MAG: hypothetical protein AAB434_04790 [Planctomycetota bacterium]